MPRQGARQVPRGPRQAGDRAFRRGPPSRLPQTPAIAPSAEARHLRRQPSRLPSTPPAITPSAEARHHAFHLRRPQSGSSAPGPFPRGAASWAAAFTAARVSCPAVNKVRRECPQIECHTRIGPGSTRLRPIRVHIDDRWTTFRHSGPYLLTVRQAPTGRAAITSGARPCVVGPCPAFRRRGSDPAHAARPAPAHSRPEHRGSRPVHSYNQSVIRISGQIS